MMGETNPKILTDEMRAEMLKPQTPASNYGLGFKINSRKGEWYVVGHSGSVAGYRADLKFDLRSKWGVAVLATSRYDPPIAKLLEALVKSGER